MGPEPVGAPEGPEKLDAILALSIGVNTGAAARGDSKLTELLRCPSSADLALGPFAICDCGGPEF